MRPPRPSDVGTTSWSKALDLYLASYDASGHAEFSGGVSSRVARPFLATLAHSFPFTSLTTLPFPTPTRAGLVRQPAVAQSAPREGHADRGGAQGQRGGGRGQAG